jgi:hypothetical protein
MKYTKRVERGAKWLDEHYPGWWMRGRTKITTLDQATVDH